MEPIEVITAFAHPTRRRISEHLRLAGPAQVGGLARVLDEQVGSISHHLRMLERVGLVERVPELATDGRTSWWRALPVSLSWSADDFPDSAADRARVRAAERANVQHHLDKLAAWWRRRAEAPLPWRRAAFTVDELTRATPAELERLSSALVETLRVWRESVDLDDGQDRAPVFVLAHGFPTTP